MKKKIVSAVILCRIGSSRLKDKLFLKINKKMYWTFLLKRF